MDGLIRFLTCVAMHCSIYYFQTELLTDHPSPGGIFSERETGLSVLMSENSFVLLNPRSYSRDSVSTQHLNPSQPSGLFRAQDSALLIVIRLISSHLFQYRPRPVLPLSKPSLVLLLYVCSPVCTVCIWSDRCHGNMFPNTTWAATQGGSPIYNPTCGLWKMCWKIWISVW